MRPRGWGKANVLRVCDTKARFREYLPHREMGKGHEMKAYILWCLLGATMLSGCFWGHIERSQTLTKENATSLVGKEATVMLTDSVEHEASILEITTDSVVLNVADSNLHIPLTNIESILIQGSTLGRAGGAFVGSMAVYVVGFANMSSSNMFSTHTHRTEDWVWITAILLATNGGALIGEYAITPNWRYIVSPMKSGGLPEIEKWGGTDPRYVLEVEKFPTETDSTVTIPWQGKEVTLPKAEITIEKHEGGFRITVPMRLLQ